VPLLSSSIPYGKISALFKQSRGYLRPMAGKIGMGAAAGAAGGYFAGGEGNRLQGMAGGALLGGAAGNMYGRGMHKAFHRAASADKGVYNLGAGFNRVGNMHKAGWAHAGKGIHTV
jgi:hypothetical protein